MKDREPRQAPPIPPRRLKRKKKSETDGVPEGGSSGVLLEPRPRLPPPPPPQRSLQRRGVRPQLIPRSELPKVSLSPAGNFPPSITGDKSAVCDAEGVKPALSTFGTNALRPPTGKKQMADEPPRRKREKGKISRPNEYPPLFFTLEDFQDVMSEVNHPYSRTLKNMTTFEPTPKPRASKMSGDADRLPETPEDEEVLFRVTTTNLPFEKSTSEWGDVRGDPNHFVFEEYVDRRQMPLQSRSKPPVTKLVLFGDDTFDREEEERTVSTNRTGSRVRFMVDSTTRDLNGELDSLQNIDSLPLDFPAPEEITLGENKEDEFGEVPFDSLLKIAEDDPSALCVDLSEDSTSSKTDFQTILVTAMVEPVPLPQEAEESLENVESLEEKITSLEETETLKNEDDPDETKSLCSDNHEQALETTRNVEKPSNEEREKGVEIIQREENGERIIADESMDNSTSVKNEEDKSAPENVRRNSFLMNMLQGDEDRVVCKVVATHPKTPIHGSRIEIVRVGGSAGAAVEAKSKLLGELSSSFSAIRLKPVNNGGEFEEKQSASDLKVDSMKGVAGGEIVGVEEVRDEVYEKEAENNTGNKLNRNLDSVLDSYVVKCKLSEEPIEGSRKPRDEPQDRSEVCSQKTDHIIDRKIYVENEGCCNKDDPQPEVNKMRNYPKEEDNSNNDENGEGLKMKKTKSNEKKEKSEEIVEVASRSSVDKCAIVLKCNNNNDNNAMTPVDVSYDQSPHNVSIMPGSVRSFVQFYEIQGETSVGLNSNDPAAVPKIKIEATGCAADRPQEISPKKSVPIENDIKYTIVARKPVLKKKPSTGQIPRANQPSGKSVSGIKTATSASRFTPVKLFDADFKRELLFHAESDAIGDNEHERRRGPRSRTSVSKKFDATVNVASGIATGKQDGSRSGVIKDVERSGTTNHSVPKSSTSTINEHYTFYCTV